MYRRYMRNAPRGPAGARGARTTLRYENVRATAMGRAKVHNQSIRPTCSKHIRLYVKFASRPRAPRTTSTLVIVLPIARHNGATRVRQRGAPLRTALRQPRCAKWVGSRGSGVQRRVLRWRVRRREGRARAERRDGRRDQRVPFGRAAGAVVAAIPTMHGRRAFTHVYVYV